MVRSRARQPGGPNFSIPAWPNTLRTHRRPSSRRPGRSRSAAAASSSCATRAAEGPTVMLLHGWMASADLNWHAAYDDLAEADTASWPSTTAVTAAGCARSTRSGWPTAPPTPPPSCASSASPRPWSSATRWAARSPSWSRATIPTWWADSCSAAPPSTGRSPRSAASGGPWARSGWASPSLRGPCSRLHAPRRPGRIRPHRLAAIRGHAPQREGHRRDRPRARPIRLAAVAGATCTCDSRAVALTTRERSRLAAQATRARRPRLGGGTEVAHHPS